MKNQQMKTLFFGSLLPVIAFAVIESWKGPVWGTVAGLVFGAGEVFFEWRSQGQVSRLTMISNAFIFVLGIITIYTEEGVWFKLQPAILIFVMALALIISSFRGTPVLISLAKKQNPNFPAALEVFFRRLNLRLGLFFLALTALSVEAAFHWSTASWALLKTVGAPVLMGVYLLVEILLFRFRNKISLPTERDGQKL